MQQKNCKKMGSYKEYKDSLALAWAYSFNETMQVISDRSTTSYFKALLVVAS